DAASPSARLAALGTARLHAKSYERVETWTADGAHRTLFFDPATGLLAGVELADVGGGGPEIASRRWYPDYRVVNGIHLPFEEDRRLGDQPVMELKITRYALNTGVADAVFDRPAPPLPPSAR